MPYRVVIAGIILSALLVGAGRFTVSGHDLTGWEGLYESLAHFWVGGMMLVVFYRLPAMRYGSLARCYVRMWPDSPTDGYEATRRKQIATEDAAEGRAAAVWLFILSGLELWMFLRR